MYFGGQNYKKNAGKIYLPTLNNISIYLDIKKLNNGF